jgi:hypothetical protein
MASIRVKKSEGAVGSGVPSGSIPESDTLEDSGLLDLAGAEIPSSSNIGSWAEAFKLHLAENDYLTNGSVALKFMVHHVLGLRLRTPLTVCEHVRVYWHKGFDVCDLVRQLKAIYFAVFLVKYNSKGELSDVLLVSDFGGVYVDMNTDGASIEYFVLQKERKNLIRALNAVSSIQTNKPDASMYAFVSDGQRLSIEPIGSIDNRVERRNYDTKVCDAFDFIRHEIEQDDPVGRFVLLEGPPGTGKSYFIGSLINECRNCQFVYMFPAMFEQIGNPSLLQKLLEHALDIKPDKIVLILEDADKLLAQRQLDNVSAISVLLNMTDGLIGKCLDLRIIATTNKPSKEIDSAITRNSRLMSKVHIGYMSPEKANERLTDLLQTGSVEPAFNGKVSLGDLYAKAHELGWRKSQSPENDGDYG